MFTLHRPFLLSAAIVLVSGTLLLPAAPLMAGSSSYQGSSFYRGVRSGAYKSYRPRSAGYNRWYPWRRYNHGNSYNRYSNSGNSYRRHAYPNPHSATRKDTEFGIADLDSDIVDTAKSDNTLGWSFLARGEAHKALKIFTIQTRNDPGNSILKVGYALAVAETGDLHKGISEMRGALRLDPDSLHQLILDEDLQGIVKNLLSQYEDDSSHTTLATAARNFMISSLYYLLGDAESAGLVLPVQDTDSSTRNLDHLIRQLRSNSQEQAG